MAKAGRKPKNPEQPKTRQISIRFSDALLLRLQQSAAEAGRPVSEEITARLERSFSEEERAVKAWGGHTTYALMLLMAQALEMLRADTGQCWHRDPFVFDQAVIAMNEVLRYFRPRGRRAVPSDMPLLEMMRRNGLKAAPVAAQARRYPFGKLAARLAVFSLDRTTPVDNEEPLYRKVLEQLAFDLRGKLASVHRGSAQADLLKGRRGQ
jgi:hypothetical protein